MMTHLAGTESQYEVGRRPNADGTTFRLAGISLRVFYFSKDAPAEPSFNRRTIPDLYDFLVFRQLVDISRSTKTALLFLYDE